ncbi:hypothetical protein DDE73_29590 (plasmid) [Bacillus thuringiensis]|nr:hypothetical protein DDE73_29590 [Bacillus thuringiensis]
MVLMKLKYFVVNVVEYLLVLMKLIILENVFLLRIATESAKFIVHLLTPSEKKLVDTDRLTV